MRQGNHKSQTKAKEIVLKRERNLISTFFWRPLEVLRFITPYNSELKATVLEKASEEFEIKEISVSSHVDRVLEVNFFTLEEDKKIYKNSKLYEWLWVYLLPLFPKKEREIIRWMLLNNPNGFCASMVARSKVYTQLIDDALRKKFELNLGQEITNSLLRVVWGVFDEDIIDGNPSRTIVVRINNEREVIGALFKKPLQALRVVFDHQMELKTTLVKKVMEEFEITRRMADKHFNSIVKSGMLIIGENKIVSQNNKLVKWLWSYLIPFYPERERRVLETMLFSVSTKFDSNQLEYINGYSERIENAVRREFTHGIDEKTLDRIVNSIWGAFRSEKLKIKMF